MTAKQIEARIMCDMLAAQITPGPRSAFDVIAREFAVLHVAAARVRRWALFDAVLFLVWCAAMWVVR